MNNQDKLIDSVRKAWAIIPKNLQFKAKIFVILSVINMVLETFSLGLIVPMLLVLSGQVDDPRFSLVEDLRLNQFGLQPIVFFLACLFISKNIFSFFLLRYQSRFTFGIESYISKRLFEVYLQKPYFFFSKKNTSDLIRNITSEVSLYAHNAVAPMCAFLSEALVICGIILLLLFFSITTTIATSLVLAICGFLFHKVVRSYVLRWSKLRQESEGKRIQSIQESFGAIQELRIYAKENYFINKFSSSTTNTTLVGVKQQLIQAVPRLFLESIAVIILLILVVTSSATGNDLVAILGLYSAAAFRLMPSANRINFSLQAIKFSEPTINLLYSELSLPHIKKNISYQKLNFFRKIQLKSISFGYDDNSKTVLKNISLTINKGDVVCLTGASGVGKSTLVNIITGEIRPTTGSIFVDDVDIADLIPEWQMNIAYVPQNIYILDGSIKHNITFCDTDKTCDEEALTRALFVSGLLDFVDALDDGVDSHVGERGGRLSGGQRQRLGLARALYRNPDLLILDEATSALDKTTEKNIVDNIIAFKRDMTILWISHNTIPNQSANTIINVLDGEIEVIDKRISNS